MKIVRSIVALERGVGNNGGTKFDREGVMKTKFPAIPGLLLAMTFSAFAADQTLHGDLVTRRDTIAKQIGQNSMLILFSGEPKIKTNDVEYEFWQNNNLYYVTGVTQPETTFVLLPGSEKRKEFVFVQDRDAKKETWTGKILSHQEVTDVSGVENVYSSNQFEEFIDSILYERPWDVDRYKESHEYDKFFEAVKSGQASVYLCFEEKPGLHGEMTKEFEFAKKLRERFLGITIHDAWPMMQKMRQVKSEYEVRMLRKAVDISAEGHLDTWKLLKPGVWEYRLESIMEAAFKRNNADWAYPSIIGSGSNATTLHYEASQRQAKEGDLILMDAAAAYQGYSADVTRTIPVDGKFSKEQADIYQIVYDAQEACFQSIKPGVKLSDIHLRSVDGIKEGLKKLGLITDTTGDQYKMWYMHGVGHWIGLDVHDAGDSWRPIEPGMTFTVEPGIYIRADTLDNLPPTPENEKLKAAILPAFEKYKNIGVRIEDDVLVTKDGYELLSIKVPRKIADVEKFFKSRQGPAQE